MPRNRDLPSFPFFFDDLADDENVLTLGYADLGAFVVLLRHQLREGDLPADTERLRRILKLPRDAFASVWDAVSACFEPVADDPDRIAYPWLGTRRRRAGARRRTPEEMAALRAAEDEKVLVWTTELRTAVAAISDKVLRDLTPDERILLGRYHVFRFANCNRSLATNRSRGAKAAVAFAKMADSRLYADLSVRGFVDEAHATWVARGEEPYYDPFLIRTVADPLPLLPPEKKR